MPVYIEHDVQSELIAQIANQPRLRLQKAHPHIRGSAIHLKEVNQYE